MKNFKIIVLTVLLTSTMSMLFAQSGINSLGNIYIHVNSEMGIHGNLFFNNNGAGTYPGIIVTNRNSLQPGALSFGERGSWENADDSRHVDGYVKVYHDEAFTFPLGNLGYYKPVSISGGYGTMAAYYYDNPLKLPNVADAISVRASSSQSDDEGYLNISDLEYWDIKGDSKTEITFYWDVNSNIGQLTNDDLSKLTLVGWTGNSWEVISSSVDENVINTENSACLKAGIQSDLYYGSITSEEIIPNGYEVFAFAAISDSAKEGDVEFGSETIGDERIELTLFPNPTVDISELNIDFDITDVKSDAYIEVYNEMGESLYRQFMIEKKGIINLPFIEGTSGIYHIGITTEKGTRVFKPVVVTN